MKESDSNEIDVNHLEQYDLLELIHARVYETSEKIDAFIMQKYGKDGLLEEESKSHEPDLQSYLGFLARNEKNMEESWEWYEKSGNQGNMQAQIIVGNHFRARFGWTHKDEDINKAIAWLEKASSDGDSQALDDLALCYKDRDEEGDFEKAVELYEKIIANHDVHSTFAMRELSDLYESKLEECDEDDLEYEELKTKTFEWLKKAADSGDSFSQHSLGSAYKYGDYCEQDYSKALEYYKKAAEQVDEDDNLCVLYYFDLGRCYHDAIGCEQDRAKAVEWFMQSAKNNCPEAKKAFFKGLGETWE